MHAEMIVTVTATSPLSDRPCAPPRGQRPTASDPSVVRRPPALASTPVTHCLSPLLHAAT